MTIMRTTRRFLLLPAALLLTLPACNNTATPPSEAVPVERSAPGDMDMPVFNDAFAYCQAKGMLDEPEMDYVGDPKPVSITDGLQQQLSQNGQLPAEWAVAEVEWRCMNNQVYACVPRQDMQCAVKLDFSRAGSRAMTDYCNNRPNSVKIPENIIGQQSPYEWLCDGTSPMVKSQRFKADQAGFNAAMWFLIEQVNA